jgi:hypothetical protein
MSIKVLSACLLVAVGSIGFYFIIDPPEPAADMQVPELAPEPRSTPSAGQATPVVRAAKEEPGDVGDGSKENPVNLDVDVSSSNAENHPQVVALAEAIGSSPRCLVEELRAFDELSQYMATNPEFDPVAERYDYANPVSEECKQERQARLTPEPLPQYEVANPAYEQYTNEQLEALAPYEADAAMLLARRIEDDRTSRTYYELATQVTRDAKPLDEWLLRRATVEYNNDVLNVEPAKLGYETALIAEAFGSELSDTREMYRDALVKEGVDLAHIEASAEERIAALKGSN